MVMDISGPTAVEMYWRRFGQLPDTSGIDWTQGDSTEATLSGLDQARMLGSEYSPSQTQRSPNAVGYTPAAQQRATGAFQQGLAQQAKSAGLKAGAGLLAGMDPASALSGAGPVMGLSNAVLGGPRAALGYGPTTTAGKIGTGLLGTALSASFGPVGSVVGMFGPEIGEGLADLANMRTNEEQKDKWEGDLGWAGGHMVAADRLGELSMGPGMIGPSMSSTSRAAALDKAARAMNAVEDAAYAMAAQDYGTVANRYGQLAAMHTQPAQSSLGRAYAEAAGRAAAKSLGEYGGLLGGGWSTRSGGRDSGASGHNVGGERGSSTGTGGGYNQGGGRVSGL